MSIENDIRDLINGVVEEATGEKEIDFTRQIGSLGVGPRDFERALFDKVLRTYVFPHRSPDLTRILGILADEVQLRASMQLIVVAERLETVLRRERYVDLRPRSGEAGLPGDSTKDGDPT